MFNTLKYIRTLAGVGFPREQAEAQVQLIMDTFQENVATKTDLAELRSELKSDLAELKSELKSEMAEIRSDVAELKSDLPKVIAELKTDLVFRLGGLIVICTGILGVLMKS